MRSVFKRLHILRCGRFTKVDKATTVVDLVLVDNSFIVVMLFFAGRLTMLQNLD